LDVWSTIACPDEAAYTWALSEVSPSKDQRPGKSDLVYRVGIPAPSTPTHTAVQGPGGVWIPPVPKDFIVGEIGVFARNRNIASIPIPGYWIHKDKRLPFGSPPSPGEKIFYLFHGGGYMVGTAHPDGEVSRILKDFLRNSSSPSLPSNIWSRISSQFAGGAGEGIRVSVSGGAHRRVGGLSLPGQARLSGGGHHHRWGFCWWKLGTRSHQIPPVKQRETTGSSKDPGRPRPPLAGHRLQRTIPRQPRSAILSNQTPNATGWCRLTAV
jgi:hypothetical protein